ncbi:MAG: hypothetical protein LBE11_05145 [Prevotellaceae bacterium]|jgi:hypothetical protein|nr:hypothetical protein [Prevotellaceae bacterium]
MKKNVVIFVLFVNLTAISAQTEIQKLPDTSTFLFNLKQAIPIDNNFHSSKNLFPAKLTVNHNDLYFSIKDTVKQDSLSILHAQKINPNLLFVRSAWFTGKSPLFVETGKRQEIKSGISIPFALTAEKLHSLSFTQLRIVGNTWNWVTVNAQLKGVNGIGVDISIKTKEERMKARAEKRKKAYTY